MYNIGIDIGGSSFKCGVVNENNEIIDKLKIPFDNTWDVTTSLEKIKQIIENCLYRYTNINSVGIGLPGIIKDNIVLLAPNLGWNNVDITSLLNYHPNTFIDNDANCAAIAELLYGNGQEIDNFIYLSLGTGIGGSIIINRKIFRGDNGFVGEIGHSLVDIHHKAEKIYDRGTIEQFAGKEGILKLLKKQGITKENELNINYIIKVKKNKIAKKVISTTSWYLGRTIASLTNILDIETYIVGGGISNSYNLIINTERNANSYCLPVHKNKIAVKQAMFKANTGIIGAASLSAYHLKDKYVQK